MRLRKFQGKRHLENLNVEVLWYYYETWNKKVTDNVNKWVAVGSNGGIQEI
jgi:hypothetical protein